MKRTRWILGLGGVALALLVVACGPRGVTPDPNTGELTIIQVDEEGGMRFEPDTVVLKAGQRVRIILENRGQKDHEFMVGRNVRYTPDGAPDGFEVDFFKGIEDLVQVQLGEGAMLMIDGETVAMGGMEMGMEEGGMEMEHGEHGAEEMEMPHVGWMVMNSAGSGRTIIEFTIPEDRVGEWEMGCFEDNGSHYEDGMRGKLIVVEP